MISIIAIVLLVACATVGFFVNIPAVDIGAIAGAFLSASLIALKVVKKLEKPTWVHYAVVIGTVLAGVLCGVGGISEDIVTSITGAVIALITIIVSVIEMTKKKGE